ncbi:ATP-binding protein [Neolewinella aurantiaca]|uniref:ATP-binding protein n=1 Tax=Neolewinella aurantiaca TaxID=2602767 RepID=A0A5C7FSU2_9BACT|nr:ATP-binding protein [Neolewinella aurantiaca]TXF89322.1 ATP-binding protein [Neolewinella aurantiaca]
MNQSLLTRLFKTIDGDRNAALLKVAYSIIEDEDRRGHTKVAAKLRSILDDKLKKGTRSGAPRTLKPVKEGTFKVPLDRRHQLPLATHIERDHLRHKMVLPPKVAEKLGRIVKEYSGRERLAHFGLQPRKRVLLYGPSGCGKSMAAEKIAWELGLPFYKVRFDSIISSYLGESAANLHSLLESTRNYPCVLLLDEFDIIGKQRDLSANDVGEIHRIVNVLLGLLEEYNGEGILIATTNLEDSLDKALFRRFDDLIEMPKPELAQVREILKMSFSALTLDATVDLKAYAKRLVGLSYAIIVKVAQDAAKEAVITARSSISSADLDKVLKENRLNSHL